MMTTMQTVQEQINDVSSRKVLIENAFNAIMSLSKEDREKVLQKYVKKIWRSA